MSGMGSSTKQHQLLCRRTTMESAVSRPRSRRGAYAKRPNSLPVQLREMGSTLASTDDWRQRSVISKAGRPAAMRATANWKATGNCALFLVESQPFPLTRLAAPELCALRRAMEQNTYICTLFSTVNNVQVEHIVDSRGKRAPACTYSIQRRLRLRGLTRREAPQKVQGCQADCGSHGPGAPIFNEGALAAQIFRIAFQLYAPTSRRI